MVTIKSFDGGEFDVYLSLPASGHGLGIGVLQERFGVNKFLRDVRFGFRLGWADPETAFTLMNGKRSIPQTLVVDAGGRIVSQWSGYSPGRSGDRLKQTIDHALQTMP